MVPFTTGMSRRTSSVVLATWTSIRRPFSQISAVPEAPAPPMPVTFANTWTVLPWRTTGGETGPPKKGAGKVMVAGRRLASTRREGLWAVATVRTAFPPPSSSVTA